MGRQISFYLCDVMRAAIQSEADRIGAKLVKKYPADENAIQFSESFGNDLHQGRLWTDSPNAAHYDLLRFAVKKGADFDRDTRLWFKRASRHRFETYKAAEENALAELVAANRKYALEVLGATVKKADG